MIDLGSILDRFGVDFGAILDRFGVDLGAILEPKAVQSRAWKRPRCQHRFWSVSGPKTKRAQEFWARPGRPLGDLLAASWGSRRGQVGTKIDFWRSWMAVKHEHDFGHLSGSILDRFWRHLGVENGAKIAPQAMSRTIM